MYVAAGSVRRIRPCSTSCITAGAVAMTFVSDARSKIVSTVIGSGAGSNGALAVRLAPHDGVAAADDDDGARDLAGGDGAGDHGVEPGQPVASMPRAGA